MNSEHHVEMLATAQARLRQLDSVLTPLAAAYEAEGYDLYLVGGSVRDALLSTLSDDLDFTTNARPEAIKSILSSLTSSVWDTGIDYGTVSADIKGWKVEITTFRSDTYDGVSRNPTVSFGDTLEGDLIRRDFTLNAIAVQLHGDGTQEFCDPLDGMSALVAGQLDTPQDPRVSFHDDPLRMLRACRFVSKLDVTVAPRVYDVMTEMAGDIQRITRERIQVELDKLMLGANPMAGIDLFVKTGLADHVFPEISALRMTPDDNLPHKDVYWHSLEVLRQAIELEKDGPDLILRWAALLHDCGKPLTRGAKPDGGVSFYGHDLVGARLVRKRMRKLRYPKNVIHDISELVALHMRIYGYGECRWTDSAVRRYVSDAGPLVDKLNTLAKADCTTSRPQKKRRIRGYVEEVERRIIELRKKEDLDSIRPDLRGEEIMEILGLSEGPAVGKAWHYMKQLRLDNGPMERDAAVAALLDWWQTQQQQ